MSVAESATTRHQTTWPLCDDALRCVEPERNLSGQTAGRTAAECCVLQAACRQEHWALGTGDGTEQNRTGGQSGNTSDSQSRELRHIMKIIIILKLRR